MATKPERFRDTQWDDSDEDRWVKGDTGFEDALLFIFYVACIGVAAWAFWRTT